MASVELRRTKAERHLRVLNEELSEYLVGKAIDERTRVQIDIAAQNARNVLRQYSFLEMDYVLAVNFKDGYVIFDITWRT